MADWNINYNKKADLTDRLLDYLSRNNDIDNLELKPEEHIYTHEIDKLEKKVEVINKDYSTELDKQLMTIR